MRLSRWRASLVYSFAELTCLMITREWDQHRALERQLDEMQFEQRAWLYTSRTEISGPISFDVNGLRMNFAYVVRNTGKNPAVQVFVHAEAKIDDRPNPEWSRRVCSMNSVDLGVSIFPGALWDSEDLPADDFGPTVIAPADDAPGLIFQCRTRVAIDALARR
jgi:hypothetical protein